MLPDYPRAKTELRKLLRKRIRDVEAWATGLPLHEIPTSIYHEGNRSLLVREDGAHEEGSFAEHIETISFTDEDLQRMTLEDMFRHVENVAVNMAGHKLQLLLTKVEESGERVHAGGRPVDVEVLFELMESVDWSFDEDGRPVERWLYSPNPRINDALANTMKQILEHPDFRSRYREIEQGKREDWRAREACRKLVG